jgi:Haem-NO-binding
MYGMVNQAIEAMVTEKFGPAEWGKIKEIAGIDDPAFLAMKQYPDSVTYALAGAVSKHTSIPIGEVLHAFGVYWIQYALRGPWGKLMKSSGASTYELLAALDDMHARIAVSFPDLQPPAFRAQRQGDGLRLEYRSHRPGLSAFVVGLVEGIGALYSENVTCTQIESKDAGAPCDAFLVHAVPAAGAA